MEQRIGALKHQIGTGHNATPESIIVASVTCPETHKIAEMHAKEVQAVFNPTSHTEPNTSASISIIAEAFLQHDLLAGEATAASVPGNRRWFKEKMENGWEAIQNGYLDEQIATLPYTFYKPFAEGDVRPIEMRGGTGFSGVTSSNRPGLQAAMAKLDVADHLFRRQEGDAHYEEEGDDLL